MKRILIVFLSVIITVFSGCNITENSSETNTSNKISKAQTSEQAETTSSTMPKENQTETNKIKITINGKGFIATLENNNTAKEFVKRLPLTFNMNELNGNEKYIYIDNSLPTDSSVPPKIQVGDLMLYGDNCIVLFYESFKTTYSYTPIAHIDNVDSLADTLGNDIVAVTFEII